MRVCAAFLLVGTLTAGEAAASSFVSPREIKGGLSRSMMVLGEPSPNQPKLAAAAPEADRVPLVPLAYPLPWDPSRPSSQSGAIRVISRSVIAMGEPPVTFEQVAAIEPAKTTKPHRAPASLPMVMRGGIIGDAFPTSAPVPVAPKPGQQVVETSGKSPAKPSSPQPVQPATPPPAPPPPPTPNLPQLRGVE